jgi:predicted dehydrogenase
MNFALLGSDYESISLATAAVAQGHRIVWCGDAAWARGQYELPWLQVEDQADQWELLLDDHFCDAVIVGRGDAPPALRGEQVSLLAKNGIALLTTFPLVDSVLSYYEIDMAQQESRALVRHFNPAIQKQPIVEQCSQWILAGHPLFGKIEQVVWERPLADRSREQVLWHFARDVQLLSQVAGRLNRLGALGSPDEEATYAGLSVQMLGHQKLPVRWSVEPADGEQQTRLSIIAEQGKFMVRFDESGRAVQTELNHAGQKESAELEHCDPATSAVADLVEALENKDAKLSTWSDALRAMELADTIEISLRRGRMIDVHAQQLSEELSFRGTMSAVGCGVLLILPPFLLALGWLGGLLGLPVARYWPHGLLALLAVFLLFQLLTKLLLSAPGDRGTDETA